MTIADVMTRRINASNDVPFELHTLPFRYTLYLLFPCTQSLFLYLKLLINARSFDSPHCLFYSLLFFFCLVNPFWYTFNALIKQIHAAAHIHISMNKIWFKHFQFKSHANITRSLGTITVTKNNSRVRNNMRATACDEVPSEMWIFTFLWKFIFVMLAKRL